MEVPEVILHLFIPKGRGILVVMIFLKTKLELGIRGKSYL